jgi:DNA-binding response OmpR family regulator
MVNATAYEPAFRDSLILVIDGKPLLHQAIAVTLVSAGYRVEVAESREDALTKAQDKHPDLIILNPDSQLVDVTLIQQMRNGETSAPVPIVLLGRCDETSIEHIPGVYPLERPFGRNQLLNSVAHRVR